MKTIAGSGMLALGFAALLLSTPVARAERSNLVASVKGKLSDQVKSMKGRLFGERLAPPQADGRVFAPLPKVIKPTIKNVGLIRTVLTRATQHGIPLPATVNCYVNDIRQKKTVKLAGGGLATQQINYSWEPTRGAYVLDLVSVTKELPDGRKVDAFKDYMHDVNQTWAETKTTHPNGSSSKYFRIDTDGMREREFMYIDPAGNNTGDKVMKTPRPGRRAIEF